MKKVLIILHFSFFILHSSFLHAAVNKDKDGMDLVPDVHDRWQMNAYMSDVGRTCLYKRDFCVGLLEKALADRTVVDPPYRFELRQKLAFIRMMTCPEKDLRAEFDRYVAAVTQADDLLTKEVDVERYALRQMEWLRDVPNGIQTPFKFDVFTALKTVKERLPKSARVQKAYYESVLSYMNRIYGPCNAWESAGADWLNEACSLENQVKVCDAGLADPLVSEKGFLLIAKAQRLADLEDFAAAEKVMEEGTKSALDHERGFMYQYIGRYWRKRAKRFYAPSWKPHLKKALEAFLKQGENNTSPGKYPQLGDWQKSAVETAVELGDFATAEKVMATMKESPFVCFNRGRIAWAKGDLDGTIEWYAKFPVKDLRREMCADYAALASAYEQKGMYREEIPVVEVLAKKRGGSWSDYYAFVLERLRKQTEKGAK